MTRHFRVQNACRVDLAGGTLDLWPLMHLVQDPVTVNLAVTLHAVVDVQQGPVRVSGAPVVTLVSHDLGISESGAPRDIPRGSRLQLLWLIVNEVAERAAVEGTGWPLAEVTITCTSGSPPGAGLGGSSALAYALVVALHQLCGLKTDVERGVDLAQGAETRILRIPTGRQDYYPGALGGALAIRYGLAGPVANRIAADVTRLDGRWLIWYSGASRSSGKANWAMFRQAVDGDPGALKALADIAAVAREVRSALEELDGEGLGRWIAEEWRLRRSLAPEVDCRAFDAARSALAPLGVTSMKACGAGGGGCLLVWLPDTDPGRRTRAVGVLDALGGEGRVLNARSERRACAVDDR